MCSKGLQAFWYGLYNIAIAMGAAFYDACCDRGLVAMDVQPRDANPSYKGLSRIIIRSELPDWEFQIGPPNA